MKKILICTNFLLAILFSFALCAQITTKEWEFPKYIPGTAEQVVPEQGCSQLISIENNENHKCFFGLTTTVDTIGNYFHTIYTFNPNKSQTDAINFPVINCQNYTSCNKVLLSKDHKTAYLTKTSSNSILFSKVTLDLNGDLCASTITNVEGLSNTSNDIFQCNGDLYGFTLGSKDKNASIFKLKLTDRDLFYRDYSKFSTSFDKILATEKDNIIYGVGITKTKTVFFSFNTENKDFKEIKNVSTSNTSFVHNPILINNSLLLGFTKNAAHYIYKLDIQTGTSVEYALNDYLPGTTIFKVSNLVKQGNSVYTVVFTFDSSGYHLNILKFNDDNATFTNIFSFKTAAFINESSLAIFNNILYINILDMATSKNKLLSIDLQNTKSKQNI